MKFFAVAVALLVPSTEARLSSTGGLFSSLATPVTAEDTPPENAPSVPKETAPTGATAIASGSLTRAFLSCPVDGSALALALSVRDSRFTENPPFATVIAIGSPTHALKSAKIHLRFMGGAPIGPH
eukprot:CAMPEP_0201623884 /NCGR_PEP_ID=MMETSP0493-20130528/247_1 /ASSEMBLY_ACC=CAM_ASM_000838 /TAXON_ID=420259 /ORGANISM="Thalassiosira gravida, Strain GMp14c1" /LENGTH=125 /DNA_ID=CAMNT_0048093599 /DNA_START=20 /DNA_END=398 /DNA_ORIENTATION=+